MICASFDYLLSDFCNDQNFLSTLVTKFYFMTRISCLLSYPKSFQCIIIQYHSNECGLLNANVQGKKVKRELLMLVRDLPSTYEDIVARLRPVNSAVQYYANFVSFTLSRLSTYSRSSLYLVVETVLWFETCMERLKLNRVADVLHIKSQKPNVLTNIESIPTEYYYYYCFVFLNFLILKGHLYQIVIY